MRRNIRVALVSLGLLFGTAACNSFLIDEIDNPNLPVEGTIQQLFVGVQAGQFAFQEGTVAMMMCQWVQHCAGTNSRFVQQAAQYNFGEGSNIAANGPDWINAYGGGGLVDIRLVESRARAGGDSTWLAVAKIWEALTIGTISAMWGDVPYSEMHTSSTPRLDRRFDILASIQTLLDEAIAELSLTPAVGAGPGEADLVFGGDRVKWRAAAHTLKARYHMHTAESLGTPAYTAAIAAANNGISDPTGASDFSSLHTTATSERSMWAQFQTSSGFGGDLIAGKRLADIMNARNDPRRAEYFCQNALGGYGGEDFNNPQPANTISNFACQPPRFADDARIPYVTYLENELILAEAHNRTGNDATALTHLNNARATVPLPPHAGLTGTVLLDSIMTEKYVATFQNIEAINDYRRTCIPALVPSANSQGFTVVPGRLFYPRDERNANPNVPDPSVQLTTHGFRNQGDVNACP